MARRSYGGSTICRDKSWQLKYLIHMKHDILPFTNIILFVNVPPFGLVWNIQSTAKWYLSSVLRTGLRSVVAWDLWGFRLWALRLEQFTQPKSLVSWRPATAFWTFEPNSYFFYVINFGAWSYLSFVVLQISSNSRKHMTCFPELTLDSTQPACQTASDWFRYTDFEWKI